MPKYFAIMLKSKGELLCSNVCWHDVPRPRARYVRQLTTQIACVCQQILLFECFWPVVSPKCWYGNKAESDLLCVKVDTLVKTKDASTVRLMSLGSICSQNCQFFVFVLLSKIFVVPDISLALRQSKNKKTLHGHNLCRDKLKRTQYWFVMWFADVFFTIVRCKTGKNYMSLRD